MKTTINTLEGLVLKSINKKNNNEADFLIFETVDGDFFTMGNEEASNGCDVSIRLEDVTGDLNDLIGHPILCAEERSNTAQKPQIEWTFYELKTIKSSVTLRWMGENNSADYSIDVGFYKGKK